MAPNSPANETIREGLEGQIRIGPTHGGPARQGVDDFKPLANTVFVVKQLDQIVASFETDGDGRFRVALAPGKYLVSKKNSRGRVGNYGPFEVEIPSGTIKKVHWDCDSGMN